MKNHRDARKICMMNCCLPAGDRRSRADMMRDCEDCDTIPAQPARAPQVGPGPIGYLCPNDPDAATAFTWARENATTPPSCPTCGAQRIPVYTNLIEQGKK